MLINFYRYKPLNPTTGVELPNEILEWLNSLQTVLLEKIDEYLLDDDVGSNNAATQTIFSSHTLIKTQPNQWHLIDSKISHTVFNSYLIIIVDKGKAKLYLTDDIIKCFSLFDSVGNNCLQIAKEEAKHQAKNKVNVINVVADNERIYLIMENRGISLDSMLPFSLDTHFDFRVAVALAVSNELLLLEQTNTVHRDLKPGNMCFKRTGVSSFVISLIDFGMALPENDKRNEGNLSGTFAYLSPDIFSKTTSASDRWAFGPFLGQILNAKNIFKLRRQIYLDHLDGKASREEVANTPYIYDDLLCGVTIPDDVDQQLIIDLKQLLEQLQNKDPLLRPSLSFINKFLCLISARRAAFTGFKVQLDKLQKNISILAGLLQQLDIENDALESDLLRGILPSSKKQHNSQSILNKLEHDVLKRIRKIVPAISHHQTTSSMLKKNLSAHDFISPFFRLRPINQAINKYIQSIYPLCRGKQETQLSPANLYSKLNFLDNDKQQKIVTTHFDQNNNPGV